MHEKAPPPITSARLARFFAWAMLWLLRYAWFLVQDGAEAKRHLRRMARTIACLIVVRAARGCSRTVVPALARHPSAAPGFARRAMPTPMRCARAGVGSWLRRRLNARTAGARLCALFNALLDLDALTERAAKRIARQLTRLTPILAVRPPSESLVTLSAPAPLCADTS
jgi:hypothetical protein